jgi:hypothetical protein
MNKEWTAHISKSLKMTLAELKHLCTVVWVCWDLVWYSLMSCSHWCKSTHLQSLSLDLDLTQGGILCTCVASSNSGSAYFWLQSNTLEPNCWVLGMTHAAYFLNIQGCPWIQVFLDEPHHSPVKHKSDLICSLWIQVKSGQTSPADQKTWQCKHVVVAFFEYESDLIWPRSVGSNHIKTQTCFLQLQVFPKDRIQGAVVVWKENCLRPMNWNFRAQLMTKFLVQSSQQGHHHENMLETDSPNLSPWWNILKAPTKYLVGICLDYCEYMIKYSEYLNRILGWDMLWAMVDMPWQNILKFQMVPLNDISLDYCKCTLLETLKYLTSRYKLCTVKNS